MQQVIELKRAWFCQTDQIIFEGPLTCPKCAGSANTVPLTNWLRLMDERRAA